MGRTEHPVSRLYAPECIALDSHHAKQAACHLSGSPHMVLPGGSVLSVRKIRIVAEPGSIMLFWDEACDRRPSNYSTCTAYMFFGIILQYDNWYNMVKLSPFIEFSMS